MGEMGDMTITLRSGTVELRGSIRTAEELQVLVSRLTAIAGWMEQDTAASEEAATLLALQESRHD